jgi:hypothetical protein
MISLPAAAETALATPRRLNSRGAEKLTGEIDPDHGVPLLKGHFVDRGIALQSRVGDHNMQCSEMRDGACEH